MDYSSLFYVLEGDVDWSKSYTFIELCLMTENMKINSLVDSLISRLPHGGSNK